MGAAPWDLLGVAQERPSDGFELNRDSLQAQGLVSWWPFSYGTVLKDFVNSQAPLGEFGANWAWQPEIDGEWSVTNTAINQSDNHISVGNVGLSLPNPYTIVVYCKEKPTTADAFEAIVNNTASDLFIMGHGSDGAVWSGYDGTIMAATVPTIQDVFTVLTFRRISDSAWDVIAETPAGFVKETGISGHSDTSTLDLSNLQFGQDRVNSSRQWNGFIYDVRFYDYAVPDSILQRMFAPATRWDLYWRPNLIVPGFVPVASPGVDTSLFLRNHIVRWRRRGNR